jgi:hypothetical protein
MPYPSELSFKPVGSHNSGLAIATVQTIAIPDGATQIIMPGLTQNVRFTLDGTAATAALGFQLRVGEPPLLIKVSKTGTTLKVIEELATAVLQYQFGGFNQ